MDGEILTNIEFDFPFNGKSYKIKKASLRQVMEFQRKSMAINKTPDGSEDLQMLAYAVYLSLSAVDKNITEEMVLDNTPGDVNVLETLATLGFLSQQKVSLIRGISTKVQDALAKKESHPSGEKSLA